ncbi:MAG: bacteriocin family protein [Anaerolineae bacterium]|nr:bacteriocin family protein [Anaerolineae bacterium]
MTDVLMRGDAPLSGEDWAKLNQVVIDVARQLLVGRQIVELTGPLGLGTQTVPMLSVGENDGVTRVSERSFLTLSVLEQDFELAWQDLAAAQSQGLPLELGPAAAASAACANAEDRLIFSALLNAQGRSTSKLGDWNEPGQALETIVSATAQLVANGFFGPFAIVLSPALYAKTQRIAQGMGRLVSKLISDVAEGGLFRSLLLAANQGIVLAQGKHNLDLVVGQDLTVAYLGNEALNHHFRVLESLALRIKRPGAICTLEK